MNHKVYRICLLTMVVITILGGIFYYVKMQEKNRTIPEDVSFVMQESGDFYE